MRAPSKSKLSIYWTWNQDFSIKHKLNLYFDTPLIIQYLLNQKKRNLSMSRLATLSQGGKHSPIRDSPTPTASTRPNSHRPPPLRQSNTPTTLNCASSPRDAARELLRIKMKFGISIVLPELRATGAPAVITPMTAWGSWPWQEKA